MKQVNWSLARLLISLAIFFNIERLDFNKSNINNVIDIHSFVYVLGIVAVLTIIFIPFLSRWSFPMLAVLWFIVFLVFKLVVMSQRPLLGDLYTYLSLTEGGFLLLLVYQAHELASKLLDLRQMAEYVALANAGINLPKLDEAEAKIRREMTRSRYYHRALSVIVIKPEQYSQGRVLPRLMKEIELAVAERWMAVKLAEVVGEQLRVVDTVLEDRENGAFVIMCPEVDALGTSLLAEQIRQTITDHLGLTVHCGTASFPDEAITFESLVSEAYRKIKPAAAENPVPAQSDIARAMGN
jgi:hypothetical protein